MISVEEALEHVRRCVQPLPSRSLWLNQLLGLQLTEDVAGTFDSPPFDKSMVDGYAIATSDASATLREIELVTAGETPTLSVRPGVTIRVMTGAPVPEGADAVIKWEDCEIIGEGVIRNPAIDAKGGVKPGFCVLRRGVSFRSGGKLLSAGRRLKPLGIALLAELGRSKVNVTPRPRVAVLATGDELLQAGEPIGPGKIYNSNGPMLLAAVACEGCKAVDYGIARDDVDDLRKWISRGLKCDALLISGGVSAGVKDLVPGILNELGVVEQFHQVRIKPGKPLWFGVREAASEEDQNRCIVFGLPGNPVSTLVSFRLFVAPALRALAGEEFRPTPERTAVLSHKISHRGGRPTYHPCRRVTVEPGSADRIVVEPLDWRGSADLATLTRADCLAILPAGDYELPAGADVQVAPLSYLKVIS